jgi:hypothetical protein
MLVRRDFLRVGFLLSVLVAYPLFHAADSLGFTGYSRFNLFVIPVALAGSIMFVNWLAGLRRFLGPAIAGVMLLTNLWISPVLPDGSKKPLWGAYHGFSAEVYYPYRDALTWLRDHHSGERILFTGMSRYYYFAFYFSGLAWRPDHAVVFSDRNDSDSESLSAAVAEAGDNQFDIILFQVAGDSPPRIAAGQFQEEKIFRNAVRMLIVYQRNP